MSFHGFSSVRGAFIDALMKKNFSKNGAKAIYKYLMNSYNEVYDPTQNDEYMYCYLYSYIHCFYEYKDIDEALDYYGYDDVKDLEYSSIIIEGKNCIVLYID